MHSAHIHLDFLIRSVYLGVAMLRVSELCFRSYLCHTPVLHLLSQSVVDENISGHFDFVFALMLLHAYFITYFTFPFSPSIGATNFLNVRRVYRKLLRKKKLGLGNAPESNGS